jgi:uncharacterized protein (DUF1697 family)
MPRYVALIRAVNVGGTGKLPMAVLKKICGDAGFSRVETYIASGNVVFDSRLPPNKVKAALEKRLGDHAGRKMSAILRTAAEMKAVLGANPFPNAPAKFNAVFFLDKAPPADALKRATGVVGEKMRLGRREIYVYYPTGMGKSKLKIPAAAAGTARNMNTVAKLAEMAARD